MSWWSDFAPIVEPDVPLAPLTWYRLGGAARWMVCPRDAGELGRVLARLGSAEVPWRVLGRGANVLVPESGFDGAVIRLVGAEWTGIVIGEAGAHAGAGADFPKLVRQTVEHGALGLEGLAGIPGTVGGAVRMNAGGKYGYIGARVRKVGVVRPDGVAEERDAAQLGFSYRHTELDGAVVTGVWLDLEAGDPQVGREQYRAIWQEKHADQPALAARSAGCIFKNPAGAAAGALLDQSGLKGTRVGGAEISSRHANFILAHPGATADDVIQLISLAKERVRNRMGFELELEVDIW